MTSHPIPDCGGPEGLQDGRFGVAADRAAGLRPQPRAASSQSSIPSAFDGTEDFNTVYDARPNAMQSRPVEVSVVGRRCVYLNNYRIAGGKPYHSENLPTHELTATLGDIINAFRKEDILAAYAEREACSEYMSAWRAARDANAQSTAQGDTQ